MSITVRDCPSREVNNLNKVVWDRKIIAEFTSLSFSAEQVNFSLRWTLESLKTNKLTDGIIKKNMTMLNETALNMCTKKRMMISGDKRRKMLNKVKPVKNINKNPRIFSWHR